MSNRAEGVLGTQYPGRCTRRRGRVEELHKSRCKRCRAAGTSYWTETCSESFSARMLPCSAWEQLQLFRATASRHLSHVAAHSCRPARQASEQNEQTAKRISDSPAVVSRFRPDGTAGYRRVWCHCSNMSALRSLSRSPRLREQGRISYAVDSSMFLNSLESAKIYF